MTRWVITAGLLSIPMILGTTHAETKAKKGATVTCHMSKFHSDKGKALLGLFKKGRGFPTKWGKASRHGKTKIKGHKAVYSFKNVTPGDWAIAVIHDENNNGKMDTNFLGIPKEGYGATRNPRPAVGAPDFEDAQFTVKKGDRAFKIRMKY